MASYQASREWEDQVQSSVMGHDRTADLLVAVRSQTGCAEAPEALQLDVSNQTPASGRSGDSCCQTPATPRQGSLVRRRRSVCQASVRATTAPAGRTLVGRLQKDSALFDLPVVETQKRRGRKRIYGVNRISLAKRAAHRHGWQEMTCTVYGKEVTKEFKTFLATHRTFGGAIRVVIVQEKTGPQFFFCTDVDASVQQVIETFADRSAIEQVFHDVKEVWGERSAAGAKPVGQHCLLAHQPVVAHADGTVGLGPFGTGTGAPGRLPLGFQRAPSEPWRSPQSVAGRLPGT